MEAEVFWKRKSSESNTRSATIIGVVATIDWISRASFAIIGRRAVV